MYPFEIHLTTAVLTPAGLTGFVAACGQLQAKPLVIELARGACPTQPMLGKVVQAPCLAAALALAAADADYLRRQGLPTTRTKIETDARYPQLATPAAGPGFGPYFEWHGKVPHHAPAALRALCEQHGAHLSANALRGESATRFVTLREFGPAATFRARVAQVVAALQPQWPLLKQESECCLYDSNQALDAGWLLP
ncbi:hypothetical protein QMK33_14690 [Hymenobacter sp. H14-R3]|uniref:hypothetical protein n=1 Tax=Hymenobacter sp. H14-R3 TaxID=3046308 RepID=UPI0024B977E5|nr:hypothetical protein [Hymenobacter sp. H14-R3]MDJ0366403.1 hypothetical protein [Hymenobacter sp. H14-R3]